MGLDEVDQFSDPIPQGGHGSLAAFAVRPSVSECLFEGLKSELYGGRNIVPHKEPTQCRLADT